MYRRDFIQSTSLFILSLGSAKLLASCSSPNSTNSVNPESETSTELSEIKQLNFGIISTESQANQKPVWEPFIDIMSEELGMPIKAFYATSYNGVIEAMRFGQVQVAWLGGKSYIEAVKIANAEAFAQIIQPDGSKGYYAYLITNTENPMVSEIPDGKGDQYVINNAQDLTFAFNDPNSTSGYLVPSYYVFAKNNINPKKVFKKLVFSGSHEATALAVANNQIDVATNNNELLRRLEKTNPEARAKIKIIWTSPEIPNDPITYRKDLPEELKEKIRNFFYNYQDKKILDPLGWSAFVPARDKDWNTIRELEIAKKLLEAQANENLEPSEKEKQIDDLKKQLEKLQS